ncbi:uncharacterized protein N7498_010551 [Penicillium cinerascens]|uniref:HypA-like protein n=1 Tax=Penicillium cinerascens TaxID=70096 RepID=A0A9W9JC27_9EURO|nr:uncharacterized protein N7498_010551 [Penicillium cinerascens]KAJ5191566.1 hypothetical protein N7498_010551 [Penicillium cinerascens]
MKPRLLSAEPLSFRSITRKAHSPAKILRPLNIPTALCSPSRLLPRVAASPRPPSSSVLYSTHAARLPLSSLTMATATEIHLSPSTDAGIFSSNVTEDAARAASEVLQEDMENHHVFFNEEGFHNHIPHQILSMYAVGAKPEDIKAAYKRNQTYQRPSYPVDRDVVKGMHDKAKFQEGFYNEKNYSNYLTFFQEEIDVKGVGDVLNEYLFAGDDRAESMLSRLFGGLVHPLIHLGFGIEFNQPAIVAQALAQTAVHGEWMGSLFFLPAEKLAGGIGKPGRKSLLQLLNEIRENKALKESVRWSDTNKIRDGVLSRAPDEMLKIAAEYTVSEDQLEERLADMINNVAYYTGAAQRPDKTVKFDFFFLHCLNSSIFFSKIIHLPFLAQRTKLRLLEWKGRLDLLLYVSRASPNLLLDEITRYPVKNDWPAVFSGAVRHPEDDGHLVKMVRALANGQKECQPYESQGPQVMPISGNMWLQIANMAVDSTVGDSMWVRSTGFDEAWEDLPGRAHL